MRSPRLASLLMTFVGILAVSGCTSAPSDLPELAPVTGTVTLDSKPLANASVSFESSNGQVAFGQTDAEGHYELNFRDGAKGAEVGENKVRIETVLEGPPAPNYRDPIPAKYNSKSTLTRNVSKDNPVQDFELTSK
ncbi:carboxypeptidase regulatory-like domain-containing protein [Bremerella cremea]|uniref:carboxypeptidase regulatory-like domain-containing protein n=1 Tax=Bremerella cremea TaxID=1031537 RepID=UPI0031E66F04